MGKDNRYENLLTILRDIRNTYGPWIHQKEIAMWSASLLHLGVIITITKLFYDNSISIPLGLNILLAILIWSLFGLFIKKQFSSLADAFSVQQAITIWIFRLINENKIPDDFDFFIVKNDVLPISIQEIVYERRKIVQRYKWYFKPFIPFLVIINGIFNTKKKISNFETEECVIYDIITFVTICYILFSYFYIDWLNSRSKCNT